MNATKTILILSANPKNTARLRLDEEVREIEERLRRSKYRDQFTIKSKWSVRLRDLRQTMLDEEPDIVHFCGHGEENGLMLEDEQGNAVLVNLDALAGLFELFKNQIECVVLNACYSQTQAEAINKHINYVIGMSQGITDKASIEFAVGFYDALGAGKSVEEAFKFGRNALQLYNIPDYLIPVLREARTFEPPMILIPSGEFLMGSNPQKDKDTIPSELPQHTIYLPDCYLSKTPVTNIQYAQFVQITGHSPPKHWGDLAPPHFHAKYGHYEMTVEIETGLIEGKFPKRALRHVLEWYELHQDELRKDWDLCEQHEAPKPVEPLE